MIKRGKFKVYKSPVIFLCFLDFFTEHLFTSGGTLFGNVALRSSSSCIRFLPHLPVTSVFPYLLLSWLITYWWVGNGIYQSWWNEKCMPDKRMKRMCMDGWIIVNWILRTQK